jgi:hypothetical protein
MNPVESVLAGMSARRRVQREDEDAEDRKRKRAAEEEDRANQRQDREHTMSERNRALQLRTDMGAAAMPTEVDDAPVAPPIGSRDEPRAPEDLGIRAAGKTFTDRAAAEKAAADYNAPQAMATRQAQVLAGAGEAEGAQKLRTGAMQEQSARFKLNADERADLDARFNADLQSRVSSWETFDAFTSDSAGDGMGGKLKLQTTVSPDGQSRIVNVVGPDGTLKPTGQTFPNTADGLAMAAAELAKMPAEKKLAHLYQKEQLRRQADAQKSTEGYQAGMLKVAQDKTAAGIEIAQIRADAAAQARAARAAGGAGGAGGAGAGAGGMTLADLKDGHKGIATTLNADWKAQIDATVDPAALKAIKVARENEIATVQRLYTGAMSAGFGLTPEQAIVAFRSGTVGTQAFTTKDGKTVSVEGVQYGGRFIPLSDNPGAAMAPAAAAPPAAKTDKPAAPAAPPATQAAKEPGMADRAIAAVKGVLSDGAKAGREMEAIRARVKDADRGGQPLTAAERAQAKKYGITPTS